MKDYFAVQNLSVGYHGKALIRDIDFAIKKGTILTLIGPNGAGKSRCEMKDYFAVQNLSVGYHGKALIRDIDFAIKKGTILTLIGPNGAGKSTILKTITGQLPAISGRVLVDGQDMMRWSPREMAKQVAVVLTDRVRPELVTCAEVVAMGRYPYTNLLGRLSAQDIQAVEQALRQVNGLELAQQDFSALSDGQRQRWSAAEDPFG